jgi:hypothetical protein
MKSAGGYGNRVHRKLEALLEALELIGHLLEIGEGGGAAGLSVGDRVAVDCDGYGFR